MNEDITLRDAVIAGVVVVLAILGSIYGIKNAVELRDKILSEGIKKYPQCAVAHQQIRCIEALTLAERSE